MTRPALKPEPAARAMDGDIGAPDPVDILARTIWGEARGEGPAGMEAVAAVVMNRVAIAAGGQSLWWGSDVTAVCKAPWQFSCWNPGDPNRAKLLAVTPADPAFAMALRIARRAASGLLPDPTLGATHYHVRGLTPRWAKGHRPVAEIGRHLFYAGIP